MEEAQLGAKVYYEKRFKSRSKDTRTMNARKDCVQKAAQGCNGGDLSIFFISLSAKTCNSKETEDCTVSYRVNYELITIVGLFNN